MSDIVSSIKTDEKGEAIIDLNEIETGDYTVSASFYKPTNTRHKQLAKIIMSSTVTSLVLKSMGQS